MDTLVLERNNRTCIGCGEEKPLEDFAWRNKAENRRDARCLPCKREYQRDYYAQNREREIEKVREYQTRCWEENRAIIDAAKDVPCADCGQRYPTYVMDFDHVRGDKVRDVSRMAWTVSPPTLREEIEKCEVVCSNCHRMRTFGEDS